MLDPFFLERVEGARARGAQLASRHHRYRQVELDAGSGRLAGSRWRWCLAAPISGFRNAAGYGLIASTIGFVFVSVGGAGLIANLTKYILGRARPKLFETTGPLDFQLFAFDPDYASFPSGHATNIFALATVLGILWPRAQGAALYDRGLDRGEPGADRPALFHRRGRGRAFSGRPFPFIVRERFAFRRWLFEPLPGGGYRLRGRADAKLARLAGRVRQRKNGPRSRLFGNRGPEFARDRGRLTLAPSECRV